jgi:probable rRNA maturation factor
MSGPRVRGARELEVSVTDARGRRFTRRESAGLATWLRDAAPARARGLVSIALVSDQAMRRLNRTYRGVDLSTDVLSFPAGPGQPPGRSGPGAEPLGDLAIALGVAARQAREWGHSLRIELRILALHGLLHLLGYDHEADRGTMTRTEDRLRRRAGLPAGLIARVRRAGPSH